MVNHSVEPVPFVNAIPVITKAEITTSVWSGSQTRARRTRLAFLLRGRRDDLVEHDTENPDRREDCWMKHGQILSESVMSTRPATCWRRGREGLAKERR
jgi:hypothetical protein